MHVLLADLESILNGYCGDPYLIEHPSASKEIKALEKPCFSRNCASYW